MIKPPPRPFIDTFITFYDAMIILWCDDDSMMRWCDVAAAFPPPNAKWTIYIYIYMYNGGGKWMLQEWSWTVA